MANNKKAPKKTGVNKGIEQGVSEEKFDSKVICKKCDKAIEFTLGSKLFVKCPRCNARVERDLKKENKQANKIIGLDILARSKRLWLIVGLICVILGAGFNVFNFFYPVIPTNLWGLGFLTLVLIIPGAFFIMVTRYKSASKMYKFYAWLAGWIVLAAIAVTLLSIPYIANWARDLLGL